MYRHFIIWKLIELTLSLALSLKYFKDLEYVWSIVWK